jgi:hypothetical protein
VRVCCAAPPPPLLAAGGGGGLARARAPKAKVQVPGRLCQRAPRPRQQRPTVTHAEPHKYHSSHTGTRHATGTRQSKPLISGTASESSRLLLVLML